MTEHRINGYRVEIGVKKTISTPFVHLFLGKIKKISMFGIIILCFLIKYS